MRQEHPPYLACIMCDSLYIKANGAMPCWCDAGETLVLERLDAGKLAGEVYDLFNIEPLRLIRRAFHIEGRLPFPEVCRRCCMVEQRDAPSSDLEPRTLRLLHVEPSWLCNLDCPLCIPRDQRKALAAPPHQLDASLWSAVIDNLRRTGVTQVETLHFEGKGDPLMHPRLAHLIEAFHGAYPSTPIMVTTNGNFHFDEALFRSGLRHLRVSVDGARADSYVRYRRLGSWERAYRFMADAAAARDRLGLPVRIEWKYILFEWNDSDAEMLEAYELATALGIELSFCLTPWAGKSRRFDMSTLDVKIAELAPLAHNRPTPHLKMDQGAR